MNEDRPTSVVVLIAGLGLVWVGLAATLFIAPDLTEPQQVNGGRKSRSPVAGSGIYAGAEQDWTPVCAIQGRGFDSPYENHVVTTQGIVFFDLDDRGEKGFFLQHQDCDDDPASSDGLFVFLGSRGEVVSPGDWVRVSGTVQEYFGLTEISSDPMQVTILARGQALPSPVDLNPPFDLGQSHFYFESLEGMYVTLDHGVVVGPTSNFDETWVVRRDLGIERVFQDDPRGTGVVVSLLATFPWEVDPPVQVGESVLNIRGALEYSLGEYRVRLSARPTVGAGSERVESLSGKGQQKGFRKGTSEAVSFRVATFNMKNLFDPFDDPEKEDPIPSSAAYRRHLRKLAAAIHGELAEPALIAVQEVENQTVLDDLLAQSEIEADYAAVWVEGPDVRGIDVALLYQTQRVLILGVQQRQGCTALVDGLGPDGNRNIKDPQNAISCDTDGDGVLDGNRLFSRPPLVVRARVCAVSCQLVKGFPTGVSIDLWLLVQHWKSKSQDTPWQQHTLARRLEQARFSAGIVDEILQTDPAANLLLLGDLNDYIASEPLAVLEAHGLEGLSRRVTKLERYTFIYQGISQVLDHILVSRALQGDFIDVDVLHFNADFPAADEGLVGSPRRSSDHDPMVARFLVPAHRVYLPLGAVIR